MGYESNDPPMHVDFEQIMALKNENERLRAEVESYQSQFFAEHDRYIAEKDRAEKAEAAFLEYRTRFGFGEECQQYNDEEMAALDAITGKVEALAQKEPEPKRECGTCKYLVDGWQCGKDGYCEHQPKGGE